jgi:formylglycine-generating enzyme required for sulfatase activity/transcriptional regulator with XRE-family HTH domain
MEQAEFKRSFARELRRFLDLNQRSATQVAATLGVTRQALYLYLQARSTPSAHVLVRAMQMGLRVDGMPHDPVGLLENPAPGEAVGRVEVEVDRGLETLGNPAPRPEPKAAAIDAYLTGLWNLTRYVEIKNLRTSDASANTFDIDELYTPLTTVLPHNPEDSLNKAHAPKRMEHSKVALHEVLTQPRLVLVGDPGAGKTTFLRRIAFEACNRLLKRENERRIDKMLGEPDPFPILIPAGELSKHISTSSPQELFDYLGRNYSDLGPDYFRRQFREGCLLLLDGLDEIPGEPARQEITELLKRTASGYQSARIVATSRPGVYGGVTSIPGFSAKWIAPLDDQAIEVFATKWGCAVYRDDANAAAEMKRVLLQEINAKAEIRRMAENPVMLTALACLHFMKTTLPEQRSELYDSVLEWLAKARQGKTGRDHNVLLGRLRKLAYAMHAAKKNKRTEIERYEAIGVLKNDFRSETDETSKRLAAERFLQQEEVNSGIIVNRGERLRFWHPTFQEYLAAVTLAYDPVERQRRLFDQGKVRDADWRETVLLLAGCLKKQGDEPADELLGKILDGDGVMLLDCVRRAGLMGALMNDLAAWQYRLPLALDERYQTLLKQALSIFEKPAARLLPFEVRLEAAEALGRAGDPRLAEGTNNWVPVERAEFRMGETRRRVAVAPFAMARYPVTVVEYERFVKGRGYQKRELWSAGGFGQFSEPNGWTEQLQYPNRPVTGVSWYEASAYCALKKARLPSEEEWECAARCGRDAVRYPWGLKGPDEHRANYHHEGCPMAPTPVGMYPEGATPGGVEDLAGNVFEWTSSWYTEGQSRVVRGGCWSSSPGFLRVSGRVGGGPQVQGGVLGFRCVQELPF